jgi:hypothetical protein
VAIEKIVPTAVAKRGRFLRRADDVREEHCSENAVRLDGRSPACAMAEMALVSAHHPSG